MSCGEHERGLLVLHDLKKIVDMDPGDMLLFPDSIVHHCNEDATGDHSSIVAFTQKISMITGIAIIISNWDERRFNRGVRIKRGGRR